MQNAMGSFGLPKQVARAVSVKPKLAKKQASLLNLLHG